MNRVRLQLGADVAHAKGLYGNGIGVAVLDSGILPHPDFVEKRNRLVAFVDFTEETGCPFCAQEQYRGTMFRDPAGHGTHVAGILGSDGSISNGKYCGLAPECHIICCRVLDEKGEGSAVCVRDAIRWVVAHKDEYGIRVLNISFGSGGRTERDCRKRMGCGAGSGGFCG